MSKELPENVRELLRYINATPALLSLLYDIDMLPEQLTELTKPWGDMLIIADHFRAHEGLIHEREDDAEHLWQKQRGIDPESGKAWLTPRMERSAAKLFKHWEGEAKPNE